ncbi:MAG: FAD-binding protein [Rhizomicrobium sp.]|nr:FAD-binding protein [Rhizomicrobium sp.]
MPTLVLAEHNNQSLSDATAKTVSAALHLGEPVHVLVAGYTCDAVVDAVAVLQGVDTVIVADDPLYAQPVAEAVAALILSMAERYDAILAPATASGKSVLPRVAAVLDVPQISEITRILSPDTFERPIYAGSVLQTVQAPPGTKVITVRATAFKAVEPGGIALIVAIPAGPDPGLSRFIGENLSTSERPELTAARVVISGGRGLGSAENFKLLEKIADKLGGAIGASRAAVDAGYVSNDHQVGQTGKVVAPDLYIAVGISGAIQHLAGIKDAKIIVAINKDEEAPIFQIADYGLVADLFLALPEMDAALTKS